MYRRDCRFPGGSTGSGTGWFLPVLSVLPGLSLFIGDYIVRGFAFICLSSFSSTVFIYFFVSHLLPIAVPPVHPISFSIGSFRPSYVAQSGEPGSSTVSCFDFSSNSDLMELVIFFFFLPVLLSTTSDVLLFEDVCEGEGFVHRSPRSRRRPLQSRPVLRTLPKRF